LSNFFAMGGYAVYVWPAFGFTALVLLGLFIQSWRAARGREVELEQLRRLVRPDRARTRRLRPVRRAAAAGPSARPSAPGGE
jgi:heme exporter protein D